MAQSLKASVHVCQIVSGYSAEEILQMRYVKTTRMESKDQKWK